MRHFGPVVSRLKLSLYLIRHSGAIDIVMSMVLNMMPKMTMNDEGGQALCSDSHTPISYSSQHILQKSLSALSGGATPMKSSR